MGKKIFRLVVLILLVWGAFWYGKNRQPDVPNNPTTQKDQVQITKTETSAVTDDLTNTEKIIGFGQKNRDKIQGGKEMVVADTVYKFTPKFVPKKKVSPPVSLPHTNVTIYLYEWGIDVSDKSIQAGTVSFTVKNNGHFSHNFVVKGVKDFGKILPGETKVFDAVCLQAGDFELVSDKAVDLEKGMKDVLQVE